MHSISCLASAFSAAVFFGTRGNGRKLASLTHFSQRTFSRINKQTNLDPVTQKLIYNPEWSSLPTTLQTPKQDASRLTVEQRLQAFRDTANEKFAVVEADGHQFKVTVNDTIRLAKHVGQPGDTLTFDKVLVVAGKEFTMIGRPFIAASSATVHARIIEQGKMAKGFKTKYRRTKMTISRCGLRQPMTRLQITAIDVAPNSQGALGA